ncbi:MAG TPA: sulfite oxidase-like oxidoreductase [Rhizomicrobium sp.]|jgi:DMSO/TMAO reductase YedYZ molybdopterin-dependent catalytic subunit
MSDDDTPDLIGQVKDKLIRAKEKWAEEGRLLTGHADTEHKNRLPPGQREAKNWPVLDLGVQPDVRPENWRLQILGLVENPVALTLPQFMTLPQTEIVSDIHCVTAWSRFDNRWQGVASRALLDLVRPKHDAQHVVFHSYDGYTTNVKLEVFAGPDVLLAHSWEGRPIPREHGGPVRVVIPRWYFWKSAKWVTRIVFHDRDQPGFWETRGYHNEGDPWKEERYG